MVSAFLARFDAVAREHIESDLPVLPTWCAENDRLDRSASLRACKACILEARRWFRVDAATTTQSGPHRLRKRDTPPLRLCRLTLPSRIGCDLGEEADQKPGDLCRVIRDGDVAQPW